MPGGEDKGEQTIMSVDRRTLMLSGVAATAGIAATAPQDALAPPSQRNAGPALDGEICWDEAARKVAADDFGHIVHEKPDGVLRPRSARDVAATIRWSAERGLCFAAKGQRHSVFGRSMSREVSWPTCPRCRRSRTSVAIAS